MDFVLRRFVLIFSVVLITDVFASHRQTTLCTFHHGIYACKPAPRHTINKVQLPAHACFDHECNGCLTAVQTLLLTPDMETVQPSSFILKKEDTNSRHNHGSSIYTCLNDTDTCDCVNSSCYGNTDFCSIYPCGNVSNSCHCKLTNEVSQLVHTTATELKKNPSQLNFNICLFDLRHVHKQCRLLENEDAVFSQNSLSIHFTDPILRLPFSGRVILWTTDYEHILTVPQDLMITIPFELLAYKTLVTIIYIHPKGFSVSGQIHIEVKNICALLIAFSAEELSKRFPVSRQRSNMPSMRS